MLSKEDNELLTRVGPGTPMGDVMRRYWMPAVLSEDVPEPDCPPVRVRILGEDLVAFRDTEGRVGIIDEFCAHRCASLFLGRNEESGLRCVYHGWKFDVNGNCLDMPNEPIESRFKEKIHLTAYPTYELGGLVWAYMGPSEKAPPVPDFEWARAPEDYRYVSKTLENANFLQAIEGGIDTVHSNFLHSGLPPIVAAKQKRTDLRQGAAPRLEVDRTPYGFCYAGLYPHFEESGEEDVHARIYQFILPFYQLRGGGDQIVDARSGSPMPMIRGHAWVPMDDEHTCVYNLMYAFDPSYPLDPDRVQLEESAYGRGPEGETFIRHRTRANDWNIDREMQRMVNFTGIVGVNSQDLAVQESMGPIVNRSKEHLGPTDRAVITLRQLFEDAVRRVREGDELLGTDSSTYRDVRPAHTIVPKGARWQESAGRLLVATPA